MRAGLETAAVMALITVAVAACGGDDGGGPATVAATTTTTTTTTATATTATATAPDAPATSGPATGDRFVVIDTDLASDDLIALAFVLSSTDVEVLAVTVSGTGEVRCPQGLDVIRGLLAATGDEGIPVACGRSTPLTGDHAFPVEWRDAADAAYGLGLPVDEGPVTAPAGESTAVELLLEATERGGVTLLTLGPLTNVAEALRAEPALAASGRVSSIVVMGGAVDVAGNVFGEGTAPSTAEWNLYVDPTAAAEVLASGAPIVLVGLDATNQVPITADFLRLLEVNAHRPPAQLVNTLLEQNPLVTSGEGYFWDPLAAAVVIAPELVTTETARIAVVTGEGPDSGRTIRSTDGAEVAVAVGTDAAAFETMLVRTLDQLGADEALVEPPPPVGEASVRYDGTTCAYDGPASVPAGRMRFTFETTDPAMGAAVIHLTGELTVEEVLDWVVANPASPGAPPGIDDVGVVEPGGEADIDVAPGTQAVVCAGSDLSAPGGLLVAGSFTVE